MSDLDVVIPTFDPSRRPGGGGLERAAASVRDLLGVGGRIIVVDDGSPAAFPPPAGVELLRQMNSGPSAARNAGLARTRAPWVLLLDDDDEAIAAGVHAMRLLGERLNAAAVVCARWDLHPGGSRVRVDVPAEWADRALPRAGDVFRPIRLFGGTGVLVSRSALRAGARFDEGLRIGEDRDFLRSCARAGPIAVSAVPGLNYTLHPPGADNLSAMRHIERRIADHLVLLARHHDPESDAHLREATRWLINQAAKSRVTPAAWTGLIAAAKTHAWSIGMKARARRLATEILGPRGAKRGHTP